MTTHPDTTPTLFDLARRPVLVPAPEPGRDADAGLNLDTGPDPDTATHAPSPVPAASPSLSPPPSDETTLVLRLAPALPPETEWEPAPEPDPAPDPRPDPGPGSVAPPGRPVTGRRRGSGDPVKALLHRHRELCERAVDPLEIAAGLEAHGITDRTAARFRHRDVFSLAEELYARVPRGELPGAPRAAAPAGADAADLRGAAYALVPGALALGAALIGGSAPWVAVLAVALTVAGLTRPRPGGRRPPWSAWALTAAAAGYAAYRLGTPLGVGLALAAAPAHWCDAVFAARARRRLAGSRALEDFAAGVRPLLVVAVAAFTGLAAVPLALVGAPLAAALPLAVLLFLTRLLVRHTPPRVPAAIALAVALIPNPVAAAAAAAGLLVHATVALSRASAHAQT
ncbi:hypothetical protein ABT084_36930 [Streptomyces sp. NPDC002138]|uniref:hypothetical protein n=1 Tax=Streptomyces sp. NPDC002138 TaxID=3154410 RepID=UPI00333120B0